MNNLSIERLSNFERDPSNNFLTRSEMMEVVKELIAVREALKGEQVPVVWKVTTPSGSIVFHTEEQDMDGHSYYGNNATPLFATPQKPVVLPAGFYADNDDALLIGRDDAIAAIEAAGGIVKDSE